MKEEISKFQFIDRFQDMGRENQFSYEGKGALYDYLESYEEETNSVIELDIISLCCEYSEYENIKEYLKEHNSDIERDDYDDEDDYNKAVFEEIQNDTTLIMIDDESFIIGNV
tara:strand:- start:43959 stop:44297 length:339 start_codon:yes stop_codon:yes gene_type:complete